MCSGTFPAFRPATVAKAPDFQTWTGLVRARVEEALVRALPAAGIAPERLHAAMRYATLEGGKRVRPLLAFAAGELAAAAPERLDVVAASIELIHAYSLAHDDLPCMDDDALRRGKPSVHVEFDQATALLAGDALQSLAFQLLSDTRLSESVEAQLEMVNTLAHAAGSRGMAGGQAADLASTGKTLALPELEFMHIHKTGALIRAAVALGASCGNLDAGERERLDRYGKCVGLAFQVVDDLLDAEASTATLGKTAGKDAKQGKSTYVSVLGAARAKAFAEELRADCRAALSPFGERAIRLKELADFIVLRKF
ncbi:MAG: polyprenyl synthetase family protein [Betaproteobacteria bacterium]|nr:polyprenyl synthetase family protein [Betaproteobacteria bacterium]